MTPDFRWFAKRLGPDLAKSALLLTGDEQQALSLVRHALVEVGNGRGLPAASATAARLTLYRKAMADGVPVDRVVTVARGRDGVSAEDLRFAFSLGDDELSHAAVPADPPDLDVAATVRSAVAAVRRRKRLRAWIALAAVVAVAAGYAGIRLASRDPAVIASGTFSLTKDGALRTEVEQGLMAHEPDSPSAFTLRFGLPHGEWPAWTPPLTTARIRYAEETACPNDTGTETEPGDVLCAGWGLMFDTTQKWSDNLGNVSCASPQGCRGTSLITNAAVRILESDGDGGPGLAWTPSVAISGDGYKVAYLDALRHRWVVADLDGNQVRDLTPELTAGQLAQESTAMFSPDGGHVAVRLTGQGETFHTELASGRTTPMSHACESLLSVAGDGVTCEGKDASPPFTVRLDGTTADRATAGGVPSPDGKLRATETDGVIRVTGAATGDAVAEHQARAPGGETDVALLGWVDDRHPLIHLDGYGYFSLDAGTGALTSTSVLPADLDPRRAVLGFLG
ncbi:hypothetical protein FXF51_49515 [Nonomuraea sp. PA05]|uniref:hypothetical protein n=1 Tax=Nonomuraea sp. PA05 TaxID=2604466 RepID=UPI0011D43295|nr:hypothetical protein [Nonomuraea sp. PA05]TYB53494.1 hypothetical protein FXF51_49515 [Nonomuraea sp. PA05]